MCRSKCVCVHTCMRTYMRERKRNFASHTTEFELFPKGCGKSLKDFKHLNEMIRFVCLKCFSSCSVETGLKSSEGHVGIMQMRNNGQD